VVSLQDIEQYVKAFDKEQASLLKKDDGFAAQISSGDSSTNPTDTTPGTAESAFYAGDAQEFATIDVSSFTDLELVEFETKIKTLKYKKQRYLNVTLILLNI
jgi:hypothetical protein